MQMLTEDLWRLMHQEDTHTYTSEGIFEFLTSEWEMQLGDGRPPLGVSLACHLLTYDPSVYFVIDF